MKWRFLRTLLATKREQNNLAVKRGAAPSEGQRAARLGRAAQLRVPARPTPAPQAVPARPSPGSAAAAGRGRAPGLRWRLARASPGRHVRVAASGLVSGGEPRPRPAPSARTARSIRAKAPREAAVCRSAPALRVFKPSGRV